jgi:hypothetical protein
MPVVNDCEGINGGRSDRGTKSQWDRMIRNV